MIVAIDVHYKDEVAKTVAITFEWNDSAPRQIFGHTRTVPGEYVPGQFYMRELPCVLDVLKQIDLSAVEAIVVDGYVYVDDSGSFGLGGHLWEALARKLPIIGVAKTRFRQNTKNVTEVYRGMSKNPLFVSSIGIDMSIAAAHIATMSGDYRIPAILKQLDALTKESA